MVLSKTAPSSRKPFTNEEWNQVIERIYASSRLNKSAIVQKLDEELAQEHRELDFVPRMNKVSHQIISNKNLKPFLERTQALESRKEMRLASIRKEKEEASVAECTFWPSNPAAAQSARILQHAGTGHLSLSDKRDRRQALEEKLRRQQALECAVDASRAKELTFVPRLNPHSREIRDKLEKDNAILIDPVTKQTLAIARPASAGSSSRNSRDNANSNGNSNNNGIRSEGMHTPSSGDPLLSMPLSQRAGDSSRRRHSRSLSPHPVSNPQFKGRSGLQASHQLYEDGMKKLITAHNTQVELLARHYNVRLRPWETARALPGERDTWTLRGNSTSDGVPFNSATTTAPSSSTEAARKRRQSSALTSFASPFAWDAEGDEQEPQPITVVAADDRRLCLEEDPLFGAKLWATLRRARVGRNTGAGAERMCASDALPLQSPRMRETESFESASVTSRGSVDFGVRGSSAFDGEGLDDSPQAGREQGTGYVEGYHNYSPPDSAAGGDLVTTVLGRKPGVR